MNINTKVVIRIPLTELWTAKQILEYKRKRSLGREDIKQIIRTQPIKFVFADVGHELNWIEEKDCFDVWKEEIEIHIIEDRAKIDLDAYQGDYGYLASEWGMDDALSIILLEKMH